MSLDWRPSVVPDKPATGEDGEPPSPPSRRRMLVIGAALLALAGVLVAFVVIGGERGRHPSAAPPPAAAPAAGQSTASSPVVPVPPRTGATDQDLAIPVTTPTGLTWSLWHGAWLPYSRTAGPSHVDGPVASGYARTPLGALIAAQQIGTRYLISPNGGWRAVTLAQVLPGIGRDRFLAARAAVSDDPPVEGLAQLVAFRYVSWTRDQAVLQAVVRVPGRDGFQVTTSTVFWVDGDWRLQLQPDGGESPLATQVPTPTGFVLWGAPGA
jgi:hypothetical protein